MEQIGDCPGDSRSKDDFLEKWLRIYVMSQKPLAQFARSWIGASGLAASPVDFNISCDIEFRIRDADVATLVVCVLLFFASAFQNYGRRRLGDQRAMVIKRGYSKPICQSARKMETLALFCVAFSVDFRRFVLPAVLPLRPHLIG